MFDAITRDPRYRAIWIGVRRAPVIRKEPSAHILPSLTATSRTHKLSETDYWRLRMLIHTHDTCKGR